MSLLSITNPVVVARLQDRWKARYDPNCEATSHIAVDLVIISCSIKLQQIHCGHYEQHYTGTGLLTVYPELVMMDRTGHTPLRIAGLADWGFGYNTRTIDGGKGSYVIAVEVKTPWSPCCLRTWA